LIKKRILNNRHFDCFFLTINKFKGKEKKRDAKDVSSKYNKNSSTITQFLIKVLYSQHGMRQAPECLDSAHISVRLRELLKAENRRFYGCSPFAGTGPRVSSTYHTAGRREAIVSTCSPLLDRFMIKVSTQYAVNLGGNHAVSGLFCVSGR